MKSPQTTPSIALLRYRFDPRAKIELHFHDVDERSLFFCPAGLPWRDGQWIFVEFTVGSPPIPCLMRGRMRAQQSARFLGSWFEFPVQGFPAVVRQLSPQRRVRERLATDVTVTVRRSDGTKALCRMSDVSQDGMRLSGLPCLLAEGEDLSIEILGGPRAQSDFGTGRAMWVRMQEAGVQFSRPGAGRTALMKLLEQAQAARGTAIEVAHSASCSCVRGARPAEPSLPALRPRNER
jgi:hypothetical protein